MQLKDYFYITIPTFIQLINNTFSHRKDTANNTHFSFIWRILAIGRRPCILVRFGLCRGLWPPL